MNKISLERELFIKIILISSYWILQIIFYQYDLLGRGMQALISLYTYKSVIDNWIIMNPGLNNSQPQLYKNLKTLSILNYLLIFLPIIAGYNITLNTDYNDFWDSFILYLISPSVVAVGYLWVPLNTIFTNKYGFLPHYCGFINLLIVLIVSQIPIISFITLYTHNKELLISYKWILVYYFDAIILIILNLTLLSTSKLGSKIASIQSVLNIIFFFLQMLYFENELNLIASNLEKLAVLMMISVCIPQFWLAAITSKEYSS